MLVEVSPITHRELIDVWESEHDISINANHSINTPIPLGYDPFPIEADLKIGTNRE